MDIFRQLFLLLSFKQVSETAKRGATERIPQTKVTMNKERNSLPLIPFSSETSRRKQNKIQKSRQHTCISMWAPFLCLLFYKLVGIFKEVINTDNSVFNPNFRSLPGCRKFLKVRDNRGNLQEQLLFSTFSTSKPGEQIQWSVRPADLL